MKPLFKWAGGKNKLIKAYKQADVLPQNFDRYVEPFLGGGAMFVWAYKQNPGAQFILNDLNEGIINIYRAIKEDCDEFLKELDLLSSEYLPLPEGTKRKDLEKRYTLEEGWKTIYSLDKSRRHFYYKLRYEHAYEWQNWSKTKEAAVLYFLMKLCFNGLWKLNANTGGRFGTAVGNINQKDKVYDKDNILEWSTALQKAEILCGDFKETLPYVTHNTFVFLDPPYRDSFQYCVDFDDLIQEEVIDYVTESGRRGAHVMMSNKDIGDNFFEERKGSMNIVKFDVAYTAGRRDSVRATEILMLNTIGK